MRILSLVLAFMHLDQVKPQVVKKIGPKNLSREEISGRLRWDLLLINSYREIALHNSF